MAVMNKIVCPWAMAARKFFEKGVFSHLSALRDSFKNGCTTRTHVDLSFYGSGILPEVNEPSCDSCWY
jgi:hypothetical protein